MKKTVLRNMPMAAVWLLCVAGAVIVAAVGKAQNSEIAGLGIAIYSMYAAIMHYLGVVVDERAVWVPLPLLPHFPFIVIGRRRVLIGDVGYITSLGKSSGFEAVAIDTVDFVQRVLFATRNQRLKFFEAMKSVKPDILIYRARGE